MRGRAGRSHDGRSMAPRSVDLPSIFVYFDTSWGRHQVERPRHLSAVGRTLVRRSWPRTLGSPGSGDKPCPHPIHCSLPEPDAPGSPKASHMRCSSNSLRVPSSGSRMAKCRWRYARACVVAMSSSFNRLRLPLTTTSWSCSSSVTRAAGQLQLTSRPSFPTSAIRGQTVGMDSAHQSEVGSPRIFSSRPASDTWSQLTCTRRRSRDSSVCPRTTSAL